MENGVAEQQVASGAVSNPRLAAMSLAALGVVFGDIGTSPLYTLKTVLDLTGAHPDPAAILGSLSLILWTLFIVTTVKYVTFAMRDRQRRRRRHPRADVAARRQAAASADRSSPPACSARR